MWGLFFIAAVIVALSLFLPSYLLLRGFRIDGIVAVSSAPLISVAVYVLLGLLYAQFGIPSSWVSLFLPYLVVSVILFACGARKSVHSKSLRLGLSEWGRSSRFPRISTDTLTLIGYLAVGVVVSSILFIWFLGSPDNYAQEYDNISHLGSIQSFVRSGIWSPFSSSLYSSADDLAIAPLPAGGFYPTAWYSIAALAATATGVSAAFAENVANFVFVALVFPSSVFLFMRVAFDGSKHVAFAGAACMMVFSAFPWMILYFGPLYPNLSAFSMVHGSVALFLLLLGENASAKDRVISGCLFTVSLCSLAFAQPNAVFTLAVILSPFCVWKASQIPLRFQRMKNHQGVVCFRIAFALLALVGIVAIWMTCYHAPFLQAVVQHEWPAQFTRHEAMEDALVLGFMADGSQIVLAFLVLFGVAATLIYRKYLWVSFSYAFACAIYVVNSYSDGPLQHILGGFWYTDPWRCGAMASLVGMVLASLGLWALAHLLLKLVTRLTRFTVSSNCKRVGAIVIAAMLVAATVYPGVAAPGSQSGDVAFKTVAEGIRAVNNGLAVYDAGEKQFVQQAKVLIEPNALVINVPDDGSAFAFAADGLRTYYRYTREYDIPDEKPESKTIRDGLYRIADDDAVKDAVRAIGATYVIQLDQGEPYLDRKYLFTYEGGTKWKGIDAIRDDTPGFEVVLEQDDMRLYRITAV